MVNSKRQIIANDRTRSDSILSNESIQSLRSRTGSEELTIEYLNTPNISRTRTERPASLALETPTPLHDLEEDGQHQPQVQTDVDGTGEPGSNNSNDVSPPLQLSPSLVSKDRERKLLIILLLAQICGLHDSTPKTLIVHVLSLFEMGLLDMESISFLFDMNLMPRPPDFLNESVSMSTMGFSDTSNVDDMHNTDDGNTDDGYFKYQETSTSVEGSKKQQNPPSIQNIHVGAIVPFKESVQDDHVPIPPAPIPISASPSKHINTQITKQQLTQTEIRNLQVRYIRQELERKEDAKKEQSSSLSNQISHLQVSASNPHPPLPTTTSWRVEHHPLNLSRYSREFTQRKLLASGAFGDVYHATNKLDNTDYAVKRVAFSAEGYDTQQVDLVIREIQCLAQLCHTNVVRYFASWLEPSWTLGLGTKKDEDNFQNDNEGQFDSNYEGADDCYVSNPDQFAPQSVQKRLLMDIQRLLLKDEKEDSKDVIHSIEQQIRQVGEAGESSASHSAWSFQSDQKHSNVDNWNQLSLYRSENNGDDDSDGSSCSDWTNESTSSRGISDCGGSTSWDHLPLGTDVKQPQERPSQENGKKQHKGDVPYNYQICLFIQMQLCHPSTLADWIRQRTFDKSNKSLKERHQQLKAAYKIFLQIVNGLVHVHSKGIVHRDMKPANIFASKDGNFKIGDFGLSRMLRCTKAGKCSESAMGVGLVESLTRNDDFHDKSMFSARDAWQEPVTEGIGTASYAAPEQIGSKTYGPAVDVFSIGLILLELFNDFGSEHERASTFHECRQGKVPQWLQDGCPFIANLILSCTKQNPNDRPTSQHILRDCCVGKLPHWLQDGYPLMPNLILPQKTSHDINVFTSKNIVGSGVLASEIELEKLEIMKLRMELESKETKIKDQELLLAEKDETILQQRRDIERMMEEFQSGYKRKNIYIKNDSSSSSTNSSVLEDY